MKPAGFSNLDPLQKQFKTLELEWDSIKQSISRSNRRTSTTLSGDYNIIQPYTDSPKELMSLLQNNNECSPDSVCRDHEAAVDFDDVVVSPVGRRLFEESEVDSEDNNNNNNNNNVCFDVDDKSEVGTEVLLKGFGECDVSDSGQSNGVLVGRRLFEESEVSSEDDNDGYHGVCFDVGAKSEVSKEFLFKGFEECDGKKSMDLKRCDVAERGGSVVAVKSGGRGGRGGLVGRWFVSVIMVLFALVIVAFECGSEDNDILVPT